MHVERWLRLVAGVMVLATAILVVVHSPNWLYFTGFIGLNLLQSAFTDWCPMMSLLGKLGVERCTMPDAGDGALVD